MNDYTHDTDWPAAEYVAPVTNVVEFRPSEHDAGLPWQIWSTPERIYIRLAPNVEVPISRAALPAFIALLSPYVETVETVKGAA